MKLLLQLLIFVIIMLPIDLYSFKDNSVYHVETYFRDNGINIQTKTYKGWIRVLLSESKRRKYHIYLSEGEMEQYVEELKELQKLKIQGKIQ
jgi:hypothetical protein